MHSRLNLASSLRLLLLPRNNHWLGRTLMIFAFVLFDYASTLAFCQVSYQEANVYTRAFMDGLGLHAGLTLFVLLVNMPIYMVLCLDSHLVKLPPRIAAAIEISVDAVFAWFVAGLHFSGGSSWFWLAPDLLRQIFGASLYMVLALLVTGSLRHRCDNQRLFCMS